jgi:hypothetical protein
MEQLSNSNEATPPSLSSSGSVKIEYRIKGDQSTVKMDCELLVVACDPRNLYNICDYTPTESGIFDKLENFTFHTTLLKVKVPGPQDHAVIFAPNSLEEMVGNVYGFRNESAKQFGLDKANEMAYNLVTVYQLEGSLPTPSSAKEFEKILKQQLKDIDWWPFSDEYQILKSVTTPYFDHFSNDDLKDGLPWKLLNQQGQNNTLYVHAFTCFESVLDCWAYAELMMSSVHSARLALPAKLDASIVILGAGASGLLFAVRLKRLGYTNINILESTDRYGGKTHTIVEDGPFPSGSTEKTVCELGACYLSPAYSPMTKDLKEFLEGNTQIDFAGNDSDFRGMVTEGEFPTGFKVDPVVGYTEYVLLKAEAESKLHNNKIDKAIVSIELASDLAKYALLHWEIMGDHKPMPLKPPMAFLQEHSSKTFIQFLEHHDLLALVGMLQYGYEVQGYGSLNNTPAYYGLVWITPMVTNTILLDSLGLEDKPVVTAWTNGWGDLWDQVVKKEGLSITYLAETTSIKRQPDVCTPS